MDNKIEFRYSWTKKDPDGGFRTSKGDTVEEVMSQMTNLEGAIGLTAVVAQKPVSTQPSEPEDPSICPVHQIRMTKKEGRYGPFYSHYIGVVPNGSWCSGRRK